MKLLTSLLVTMAIAGVAMAQERRQDCNRQGPMPKTWEGLAFATDGDSLAGIGLKPPLRLWGMRAPQLRDKDEQETVPGMRARAALEDMLTASDHNVSCRIHGWDGVCRLVAQCAITAEWPTGSKAQSHDLALRLVEDGLAYGFGLDDALAWDKDASAKIAHFEALARQARKGLWPIWLGDR
jgi:endonuclease YncB( thermonuclease family)